MKKQIYIILGSIASTVLINIFISIVKKQETEAIAFEEIVIIVGVIIMFIALIIEIYKLKIKNDLMLKASKNGKFILNEFNGSMWEYNINSGNSSISERCNEILELEQGTVKTINGWFSHIHKEDVNLVRERLESVIVNAEEEEFPRGFSIEHRVVTASNKIKWVLTKGVLDMLNDEYVFSGVNIDITDKKEKEFTIEHMSYYDSLTGLFNRAYLKELINNYISYYENKKAALIFVDIDDLKEINDSQGHSFGDSLLKSIAIKLKRTMMQTSIIGRFEGDQFIIFMPNAEDISDVEKAVRDITQAIRYNDSTEGMDIHVSGTIGVAIFPEDATNFDELLKNASTAMGIAKTKCKGTYQFYNIQVAKDFVRRYNIKKYLSEAIKNGEMHILLQPKVVLRDHRVIGFEALARWNSKALGFVSPGEFIPIAEDTKMIIDIGEFIIEEGFRKCKALIDMEYKNFKIAINLSEVQLQEGNVVDVFKKFRAKYMIPYSYMEVEITESILMNSLDKNREVLLHLKKLGISIALDDFGTGYSSLNYLAKLPIDVLKIDKSFVDDVLGNKKSKLVIENIINLSHGLGIEVVAEGVEDKEQVEYLKSVNCDFVQGYYFSKPEAFDKVAEIMKHKYIEI